MNDLDSERAMAEVESEISANVKKAADRFAGKVRSALPKRSGKTAAGVRVLPGSSPLQFVVNVPYPWQYSELGTSRQKPNPVLRRTLLAETDQIERDIAGE